MDILLEVEEKERKNEKCNKFNKEQTSFQRGNRGNPEELTLCFIYTARQQKYDTV